LDKRCDFSPLFCKIDALLREKKPVILAIDGNSAAGKSSLAKLLKSTYSCNVLSMDDFFLRPVQRTSERLAESGGNVDYERFSEEVLGPLQSEKPFTYRPYSCQIGELIDPVSVSPTQLSVVEGVYSLHPHLIGAYDIKVFLCLGEAEQRRRLLERNPPLYDRFANEWIPMENRYFACFGVAEQCDFVFDTGANDV